MRPLTPEEIAEGEAFHARLKANPALEPGSLRTGMILVHRYYDHAEPKLIIKIHPPGPYTGREPYANYLEGLSPSGYMNGDTVRDLETWHTEAKGPTKLLQNLSHAWFTKQKEKSDIFKARSYATLIKWPGYIVISSKP